MKIMNDKLLDAIRQQTFQQYNSTQQPICTFIDTIKTSKSYKLYHFYLQTLSLMKKATRNMLDFNTEEHQDSDTYCPSVQRALFKQCKLQELLAQSQLKKAGIQTAEALINMLYEEIKSLKSHKLSLQTQITHMLRQFSQKEEHLKRQISFLEADLRQVIEMRDLKSVEMREMNSRSSLSKCFIPTESRKLSAPNTHRSIERRLEQKVQATQSPIRKISLFQTVSKEYIDRQDIKYQNKICQEALNSLLSNDLQRLVVDFEEISNLIKDESDELTKYICKHQENIQKVKQLSKEQKNLKKKLVKSYQNTSLKIKCQQIGEKSFSKKQDLRGKKLFSTQNSNQASPNQMKYISSWQDNIKEQNRFENGRKSDKNYKSIMREYENIIQQYKQYSAYLRAYLCSCIGFISKLSQEMSETNIMYCLESERLKKSEVSECQSTDLTNENVVNFPSNRVFEVVLKEIISNVEDKIHMEGNIRKQVQEQNSELRLILDELVQNLKRSGVKTSSLKQYEKEDRRRSKEVRSSFEKYYQSPVQHHNIEILKTRITNKRQSHEQQNDDKKKNRQQKQKLNRPYKKFVQGPQFHRITLTQYKRYGNQEE